MPIPVAASLALIHAGRNETVANGATKSTRPWRIPSPIRPGSGRHRIFSRPINLSRNCPIIVSRCCDLLSRHCTRVIERYYRGKVSSEATQTIVAILEFKAEKQRWPESLAELKSAGLIAAIPMDPFGDGPLVYRKEGEAFTLYSRGCDLEDDGGKVVAGDPWGENAGGQSRTRRSRRRPGLLARSIIPDR